MLVVCSQAVLALCKSSRFSRFTSGAAYQQVAFQMTAGGFVRISAISGCVVRVSAAATAVGFRRLMMITRSVDAIVDATSTAGHVSNVITGSSSLVDHRTDDVTWTVTVREERRALFYLHRVRGSAGGVHFKAEDKFRFAKIPTVDKLYFESLNF